LPHWYLEISNTEIFVKDFSTNEMFIEFRLKKDLKKIMRIANRIERELVISNRKGKSMNIYYD